MAKRKPVQAVPPASTSTPLSVPGWDGTAPPKSINELEQYLHERSGWFRTWSVNAELLPGCAAEIEALFGHDPDCPAAEPARANWLKMQFIRLCLNTMHNVFAWLSYHRVYGFPHFDCNPESVKSDWLFRLNDYLPTLQAFLHAEPSAAPQGITLEMAAQWLGVTKSTVSKWITKGRLTAQGEGKAKRVTPESVERLARDRKSGEDANERGVRGTRQRMEAERARKRKAQGDLD